MKTFFTSDIHFFHKNIITYCKRPFADVAEMNEKLVENWNSVVSPEDATYVLGDVSFGKPDVTKALVARLNGTKVLVAGNHDRSPAKMLEMGFNEVLPFNKQLYVMVDGRQVLLHHIPIEDRSKWEDHTDYHLCGHVHTEFKRKGNIINVGVDVWDFKPRTFEELIAE